jgi:hypothetical protein
MAEANVRWQLEGDYFENCNCDVVCPCLISAAPPLTAQPTRGACEIPLAFHIDRGTYGSVNLAGLNVVAVMRTPGVMAEGNASLALYLDERATDPQREALGAIFSGQVGGPIAAFAPLVSTVLGVKTAPITYKVEGKRRSVAIPGVLNMAVNPLPSMRADGGEIWAATGHPVAPDKIALAVGEAGSTYKDYGMSFDNSGKNAAYAPIKWSNG